METQPSNMKRPHLRFRLLSGDVTQLFGTAFPSDAHAPAADVPPAAVPPSPMPEPPLADTPPPPAPRLFSAFRAIPASSGPHHPGAHGPEATTDPLAGSGSVRESPCPSLHPPPWGLVTERHTWPGGSEERILTQFNSTDSDPHPVPSSSRFFYLGYAYL